MEGRRIPSCFSTAFLNLVPWGLVWEQALNQKRGVILPNLRAKLKKAVGKDGRVRYYQLLQVPRWQSSVKFNCNFAIVAHREAKYFTDQVGEIEHSSQETL